MDPLNLLEPPLRADAAARLEAVEGRLHAAVAARDPLADRSSRHLLTAGGKRFRPLVTVLVATALGAPGRDRLTAAACASELLHLSTLYHDDVIDGADVRRGVPSANARWGERLAVLAGDRLTALAFEAAADAGDEVPGLLARTYRRLVEGERLEASLVGRIDVGVTGYLEVVDGKTASLIAAAARAGAAMAGAAPAMRTRAEAWGRTLGVAFQLADDLLDLTASAEVAGKPVGHDLELGVYTWPVLDAIGSPAGVRLQTVLRDPPPHPRPAVEEAMQIVHGCGAVTRAGRLVERFLDRADDHLGALPPGPARTSLRTLGRALVPPPAAVPSARVPEAVGA
ncbi:polyprenyl synthetase family protein [Egicoccus sp. AB-alg2]|uniref:polyprenyl synthetase family protein n=1 Tax=Egicoccus sp. AB-alg2 TaxID=3242693 RepID=UPI00359D4C77